MSFESQPTPPRPTLEDLLRYKRAERPSPEFWAEFDRGLRQKQLAALMKQPKGWARWRPLVLHGARWAVPATAATAAALVVVQISWPNGAKPQPVAVASHVLPSVVVPVTGAPSVGDVSVAMVTHQPVEARDSVSVTSSVADHSVVAVAQAGVAEDSDFLPWPEATYSRAATFQNTPVAFVSSSTPAVRRARSSWTSHFNEIAQAMASEHGVEGLFVFTSMDLPAAEPAAENVAVASVADTQQLRHSVDRDFRDLDTRFGVTGSSLSIKF